MTAATPPGDTPRDTPRDTPLRVLLVDDEPLSRRALRQLLDSRADVDVVGECGDVHTARERLADVDAVLLDIEMPGESGLELARERSAHPLPALVFVTAFDRYAVPAFATEALDYLCKPVLAADLQRALGRIRDHVARQRAALAVTEGGLMAAPILSPPVPVPRPVRVPPPFLVRTGRLEEVITWDTVDCVEADDVYAAVHVGARRWLLRQSLATLIATLPPRDFLRVHRSWIVRRGAVRALRSSRGSLQLMLHSGRVVPVSRRSAAAVREWARGG